MAVVDGALAVRRPVAQLPRAITDLLATDEYLQARAAAADDGRQAITIVREHAARFGVRPDAVGMIGFSAGAFLAVDVALDPRDEPLAFVGAIYGGETLGQPVPADAPPLFSVVAQDDILWKIVEGVHADWSAADRSSELHVFARGAHGFGMVRQGTPSDRLDRPLRRLARRPRRPLMSTANGRNPPPLDGIHVVDFSRIIAGPLCTQQLADLGADVIKIEHPVTGDELRARSSRGDQRGAAFLAFNRSKRSIAIDLGADRRPAAGTTPGRRLRCRHRELPSRGHGPPRPRPGRATALRPGARLRVDLGLRLERSRLVAARVRPDPPGRVGDDGVDG